MSSARHVAIAIDGPAASGKSSVARRVAKRFGIQFVNSGAMYRAFTWQVLRKGVDPADSDAVIELLEATNFQCGVKDKVSTIAIDGDDPGEQLQSDEVAASVSSVAAIPEVREQLVAEQRRYREVSDLVMEGRDIGTVVFADTIHKFYLDASPEVRAKRRAAEGIIDDIRERDRKDSSRKTAPLTIADDATVIDTSEMNLEQVVDAVSAQLEEQGLERVDLFKPNPMTLLYRIGYMIFAGLLRLLYRYKVVNRERVRMPGGCIVAANHESYFDPPTVGVSMDESISYAARKSLFTTKLSDWLYRQWGGIPLDQEKADLSALRTIIKTVRGGKKVLIFPEGERTPTGEMLSAAAGVGMLVAKTRAPVLPMRVFGLYDIYPIHAKRPNLTGQITVVVGEPIHFSAEELAAKDYQGIADRIMFEIAALKLPD
ncbi:MAG: cytidylate kinase [Verrucomicrobiales bacterium]|jgi:cytidylate kinase